MALFQKIRIFAFSKNRTFPKNPDFHQKPLHMRVRILSKPLYIVAPNDEHSYLNYYDIKARIFDYGANFYELRNFRLFFQADSGGTKIV